MKNLTSIIIAVIMSYNGIAQYSNYDLSKYKLPDTKRKSLETAFNLSGINTLKNFTNYDDIQKIKSNSFNNTLNVFYSSWANSATIQKDTKIELLLNTNLSNQKVDNNLQNKQHLINPRLYVQKDYRYYFKNNYFLEADVSFLYYYDDIYSKNLNNLDNLYTEKENERHNLHISVPLKIGKGRLEQVQDLRQAIYIIDELTKIGKIKKTLTQEELYDFADYIANLKSERFFDTRLKKMEEIERLDSFLQANYTIDSPDAKYFTTLTDFWEYAQYPFRLSGNRMTIIANPSMEYHHLFDETTVNKLSTENSTYYTKLNSLDFGLEFTSEKPFKLKWQNSFYAKTSYGLNEYKNSQNIEISRIPKVKFDVIDYVGFYPNTRTNINFGLGLNYEKRWNKTDVSQNIVGDGSKQFYLYSQTNLNYYISSKARLSAYYHLNFQSYNSETNPTEIYYSYLKSNSASNTFNIRLTYSLF